jgi:hypothetical protein
MIAYFDTNIFDHLEQRNGVTEWDLYRIGRAIKLGYLRIVLSFLNIEETLFIVQSQPERADARVRLILELCDKHLVAIGQEEIMNNDIRAYAHGTPRVSPFMPLDPWIEFNVRSIAKPSGNVVQELEGILLDTRQAKNAFLDFLIKGRAQVIPAADSIGAKGYPFENYWTNNAGWLAEGLAKRARAQAKVSQRGVDGLLKVKSVALAVGANLSLIYSHHFENRTPAPGDSRDILHAVVASTAEAFVTNDGRLETALARIPIDGFRVMSLQAFLKGLPAWI